jgi:curved DNA-binding protein CbpA
MMVDAVGGGGVSEWERDLYALLGMAPDGDAGEVARAYRRRLREVHPDTRGALSDGPDPAHTDLRALQEAYAVLRDPARRARYDAQRRAAQKQTEAPATGIVVPVRVRTRRPAPTGDWLIRVGPVRSAPPQNQSSSRTESLRSRKSLVTIVVIRSGTG